MKTISNCKSATPVLGPCEKIRVEMFENKSKRLRGDSYLHNQTCSWGQPSMGIGRWFPLHILLLNFGKGLLYTHKHKPITTHNIININLQSTVWTTYPCSFVKCDKRFSPCHIFAIWQTFSACVFVYDLFTSRAALQVIFEHLEGGMMKYWAEMRN